MASDAEDGSQIAVIGLAGRFPGARDVDEFWKNLCAGVESVTHFTDDQLRAAGESPALIADPAYVRVCPALADIELFDAGFFGWSPRDAAITDPQHRIFLETAWQTLENAGYDPSRYGRPIGVFASSGMPAYMMHHLVTNAELMEQIGEWLLRHTGNDMNFLATRASYEFDLRGPSVNVQTACSSSLVAIHSAMQSLLTGECDMALAGASAIVLSQDRGYLAREGEILSPDGHCRPFDVRATGTLFGGGAGCVLLKRLSDAVADGDQILATIRGSAINNDGAQKVGFLAPSVGGQARVISEALAVAGLSADEVGFVEAHGTGTAIGDPIEVKALTQAFRESTTKRGACALGSVKANIGHLGEAAGMAGFIKTVMALRHRQIPPLINFTRPSPELDLLDSPFFINTALYAWTGPSPRVAGITALGAGGTNAHILLEEAPAAPAAAPTSRPTELLLLSAKSAGALDAATANLTAHLTTSLGAPTSRAELADVAYTLAVGRKAFPYRRIVVGRDGRDIAEALDQRAANRVFTQGPVRGAPPVVFMFAGGGAQHAGMGAELYQHVPSYRAIIDQGAAHMKRTTGLDLLALMYPASTSTDPSAAGKRLEAPSLALPTLFATEYALANLLIAWGIAPDAMIGHSMGEYVAACLAGVLSYEDALSLVALRGRLFETVPPGGMLSVPLPEAEIRAVLAQERALSQLSIAAVNAPSLCVVSGANEAIQSLQALLTTREIDSVRIHIAVPAHSEMLAPILPEFERHCRTIAFGPPKRRYVSNLTGGWITAAETTNPRYWVDHLRHTVKFSAGLATLGPDPSRVLLEVGPGRTLTSLVRAQLGAAARTLQTLPHPGEPESAFGFLQTAVGRLWTFGVDIDWPATYPGESRRRVALPTYPFERKRCWIPRPSLAARQEAPAAAAVAEAPLRRTADPDHWFSVPAWRPAPLPATVAPASGTTLVLLDAGGVGQALARKLAARGAEVITVQPGASFTRLEAGAYALRLDHDPDHRALMNELRASEHLPRTVAHLGLLDELSDDGSAETFARGRSLAFDTLIQLARSLAAATPEARPVSLLVVATGTHQLGGETPPQPAKALALGACRVLARELPALRARSVDVVLPPRGSWQSERLVEQLADEVTAGPTVNETVIAYRGDERLAPSFEPARAPREPATGLRPNGVYLITGGLENVGLAIAERLAHAAAAKLVLVGSQGHAPLPPPSEWPAWLAKHGTNQSNGADGELVRRLQALAALPGVEVQVATADVSDREQMRRVVAEARQRFGAIHGVVHAAGAPDQRAPDVARALEDRAHGALVLDALLDGAPDGQALDFFVLLASVDALVGGAGPLETAAADAFVVALAQARSARAPGLTVAISSNAWVGLAGDVPRGSQGWRLEKLSETDTSVTLGTAFSRERHWLLGEHVIRGGESLIPGTGFLELSRAALGAGPPCRDGEAVLLTEVVFLSPFVVKPGQPRSLRLTLDKRDGQLSIESDGASEAELHVTGRATTVKSVTVPEPAAVDLAALRARCPRPGALTNGFLEQAFMDFGPRWGNLTRLGFGQAEAVADLALPDAFAGDLTSFPLHPALLDMATGGAQALVPGFEPTRDFFVPFSYGRVLLRRPLTAQVTSHIRYRSTSTDDTAVFDVTLLDPDGRELVSISDFVMKRGRGAFESRAEAPAGPAAVAREAAMTGDEGLDALMRILARRPAPHVIASALEPAAWKAALAAAAVPAVETPAENAAPSALPARHADIADWFYRASWRLSPTPPASAPAPTGPATGTLVFCDRGGLGTELAAQLEAQGRPMILVEAGAAFARSPAGTFVINPSRAEDYVSLLRALGDDPRPAARNLSRIVHLWLADETGDANDPAALTGAQELGFFSLLYLAQAMATEDVSGALELTVIASQVTQVAGEPVAPAKATVLGPVRVIPRELLGVTCRLVDVRRAAAGTRERARTLEQLRVELLAPPTPDRVIAYRDGDRFVQAFEPLRLERAGATRRLRKAGVYLITGGLGGLGLSIAARLARDFGAKIVLMGRRPLPERGTWDAWLTAHPEADPTSRRIKKVREIEALGGEVHVVGADVTRPDDVRRAIAETLKRFGTLHGVLHTAGVLDDGVIALKQRATAEAVLAPKVAGALALDQALTGINLDFFALFSSISALCGLTGQVDYAAANAFLDAFAQDRMARGAGFTLSINWSGWREVGMAAELARQLGVGADEADRHHALANNQLQVTFRDGMLPDEGAEALERMLDAKALSQLVVTPQDLKALFARLSSSAPVTEAPAPASKPAERDLGPLEAVLVKHEAVAEAAAREFEERPGERRIVAYLVYQPGEQLTVSELRRFLRGKVGDELIPQTLLELDALPRTGKGATDRAALPNPFGDVAEVAVPTTPTEKAIAGLWREILGVEQIGRYDNFFDIGGHSLLSARLIARITKQLGVRLQHADIVASTLQQLAAKCSASGVAPPG